MKVEMTKVGKLIVTAETPIEGFALDAWAAKFFPHARADVDVGIPRVNKNGGVNLIIDTNPAGEGCTFKQPDG